VATHNQDKWSLKQNSAYEHPALSLRRLKAGQFSYKEQMGVRFTPEAPIAPDFFEI